MRCYEHGRWSVGWSRIIAASMIHWIVEDPKSSHWCLWKREEESKFHSTVDRLTTRYELFRCRWGSRRTGWHRLAEYSGRFEWRWIVLFWSRSLPVRYWYGCEMAMRWMCSLTVLSPHRTQNRWPCINAMLSCPPDMSLSLLMWDRPTIVISGRATTLEKSPCLSILHLGLDRSSRQWQRIEASRFNDDQREQNEPVADGLVYWIFFFAGRKEERT